jgi:hypothetical protein
MKNGIFDFKDGISMKITRSDPKTFGEKLRKARMDAVLLIKELTALEKKTDFPQYQHLLIIPGAFTMPGKGYGMICYCAKIRECYQVCGETSAMSR